MRAFEWGAVPALGLAACTSTHYVAKEDLLRQVDERGDSVFVQECREDVCIVENRRGHGKARREPYLDSLSGAEPGKRKWAWNRFQPLETLDCRNGAGERVRIGVDPNTQLLLFDKHRRKTQMYFQSAWHDGTRIRGYRSNIVRNPRELAIADIDSIEIYSEFKSERPAE